MSVDDPRRSYDLNDTTLRWDVVCDVCKHEFNPA
jgi:hypothetical protein